jgi:Nif-specific regulatory protein
MAARLVSVAGPVEGAVWPLGESEISIGRLSSSQVRINHPSVSRRHCRITPEAGRYKLKDLDSSNGVFLNGVPVSERLLEHGDQIRIGGAVLLFLVDEGEAPQATPSVAFDEGERTTRFPVEIASERARYLEHATLGEQLPAGARVARDLNVLLHMSTELNAARDLDTLQSRLLDLLFEAVPADRAAVLLVGDAPDEFASVFGRERGRASPDPILVSRTIVRRVLDDRVALLGADDAGSELFSQVESLRFARATSVLAAPLLRFERPLGVLYLDQSGPATPFDRDHLELVTAAAAIAAMAVENVRQVAWLEGEARRLRSDLAIQHTMVGENPKMCELFQRIGRVAPTDATVLIAGESGTGKELIARAIHQNSPRAARPFMGINCAALTESLLESELFGYEKGAFTGATAQRKGKLEVADGGTVFLDEIGELAPTLQAKLLRVLQEREFERVGGTRPIKVDIRLVAATNRDLEDAVKTGGFRRDLYYRLNVVSLTAPPLRARREDIPLLASYFAAKYAEKCNRHVTGISAEARACLLAYDWPGNVRELENAVERAVVLGSSNLILAEDLPETVLEAEAISTADPASYHARVRETKRRLIREAVERAGGNYTEAAKLLGVQATYLHRLMRNLGVEKPPGARGER